MTPFNVEDNNITFEIEDEDSNFNISPRNINFRVQNDEIDTDLYPGALVLKDYNLLDNKPSINGVELEGDKTSSDLGLDAVIGSLDEISPSEAIRILSSGRMVLLETTVAIGGFNVPMVFVTTLIAANMVGATQTVAYIDNTTAVRLIQLTGVGGGTWSVTMVNMARAADVPDRSVTVPVMDTEEGTIGSQLGNYALADHRHPSDTSRMAATAVAKRFTNSTAFAVGEYCTYQSKLYRCLSPIIPPSDFNSEDWEEVVLTDEMQYTAGDNIDIEENEISVTGTVPKAAMALGIPYGECDSTSTSTVFTATVPGITELKNGVIMLLKNGVVTSASGFTININGLGAKPSYNNLAAATADTTLFNVAYTMLFIYDEDRVAGGCWIMYRGYDSNTNTIGYQLRTNTITLPMDSITYRYRLLFRSVDGNKFVPANNSTSTNATAKRTTIGTAIDPFGGIYYYGTTASVAAGSRPGATYLWQQYSLTLGYSFNRTGATLTLTSYKPVYIKATPQASGGAIIEAETPYVQDLPTTNDGKIYIYLGVASSATAVEMTLEHPVYYHDGTKVRLYTG